MTRAIFGEVDVAVLVDVVALDLVGREPISGEDIGPPDDRDVNVVSAARHDGAETPAAAGHINAAVNGPGVVAAAFGMDQNEGIRDQGFKASRPTGGGSAVCGRWSTPTRWSSPCPLPPLT
jgi:hypothetical protein